MSTIPEVKKVKLYRSMLLIGEGWDVYREQRIAWGSVIREDVY